jgi:hypothetical protein
MLVSLERTQPVRAQSRYLDMQIVFRPLYCRAFGDHCTLTLRVPCGRALDLLFYDGGGFTRSIGVWRLAGGAIHVAIAHDC